MLRFSTKVNKRSVAEYITGKVRGYKHLSRKSWGVHVPLYRRMRRPCSKQNILYAQIGLFYPVVRLTKLPYFIASSQTLRAKR